MKKQILLLAISVMSITSLSSCVDMSKKQEANIDPNGTVISPSTNPILPSDNGNGGSSIPGFTTGLTFLDNYISALSSYDYASGVKLDLDIDYFSVPTDSSEYQSTLLAKFPIDINLKYNKAAIENSDYLNAVNFNIDYSTPATKSTFFDALVFPMLFSMVPSFARFDNTYFAGFRADYIGDGNVYYSLKADTLTTDEETGESKFKGDQATLMTDKINVFDAGSSLIQKVLSTINGMPDVLKLVSTIFNGSNTNLGALSAITGSLFNVTSDETGTEISLSPNSVYLLNIGYKKLHDTLMNLKTGNPMYDAMLPMLLGQFIPEDLNNVKLKFVEENGVSKALNLTILGNYYTDKDIHNYETRAPYTMLTLNLARDEEYKFDDKFFFNNKKNVLSFYEKSQAVSTVVDKFNSLDNDLTRYGDAIKESDAFKNDTVELYNSYIGFDTYQKAGLKGYTDKFNTYYPVDGNIVANYDTTDLTNIPVGKTTFFKVNQTSPYKVSYVFSLDKEIEGVSISGNGGLKVAKDAKFTEDTTLTISATPTDSAFSKAKITPLTVTIKANSK